ncbi:MAG TPA: ACT domain-containing protein [Melioribacteraceae bacterium]|nr:ACT domain-containing protein [Melioribacteraceae bacterium]
MKLSEDELRKLTLIAIEELGNKATPDSVKKIVSNIVEKNEIKNTNITFGEEKSTGRMIITAFGLNKPGIVAAVTKALGEASCDIQDITQKLMNEYFTMIMIVDLSTSPQDFKSVQDIMSEVANSLRIKIYCQHEDIFRNMHRI